MASGSFKDTVKALNGVFATNTHAQHLPKEVQEAIDAYLEKHHDKDEHDTERLQDELKAIHTKFVAKEPDNLDLFLQLLKALRPGISSQICLHEWWTLAIQPVIDGIGHTRSEISHASDCLLAMLDYDVESDKDGENAKISAHFAIVLLDAYLRRTRIHDLDTETLSNEDDFVAQQLGDVLVAYGRKKPKDFMLALDRLFIVKDHRMQVLGLLSAFVQNQPPHLYLVRETPLVEHLLQCLLVDTSTTVISLALTTLIMFLPHIPSSVRAHLARLFLIYSRLLCWERWRPSNPADEKQSIIEEEEEEESENDEDGMSAEPVADEAWEKLESTFEHAESTTPELLHYFTFLYGLYPLNFTSYIRKPRKYLKSINFPRADEFDLDQKIIRLRSEQFSRLHILHPSFINTTLEDELTENRWLKTDPVDVVAECISLCLTTLNPMMDSGPPASAKVLDIPPAFVKTEDIPSESLLGFSDDAPLSAIDTPSTTENGSVAAWRAAYGHIDTSSTLHRTALHGHVTPYSQSSAVNSPAMSSVRPQGRDDMGDSPTLGATVTPALRATSHPRRHGSVASLQSGAERSPRVSAVHIPAREEMPRSPALRPAGTQSEGNLAFLQREVTLLKSDLKFERYLKQQHLTHIGQLQRKQIKEATAEAETQNLINSNRTLKNKLVEASKAYALLKKETATNRSQSKKYEAELTSKVRALKEDERQWRADEETFRADLAKAQSDRDHLRGIVVDSEARELLARQEVASATLKLEQLETLYKRVQELEAKLQAYEARELEFEQARDEKDILTTELATATLRLQSRDTDYERERQKHDRRLLDLEKQLQTAQSPTAGGPPGQLAPQAQNLIDKAVAEAKAKHASLKKEHVKLQHRYLELEIRCKEYEQALADASAAASSSSTGVGSYGSRHQSPPFSPFDTAGPNSNSHDSRSSSYTRHTPIPIPNQNQNHALSSSATSRTRPTRPTNSPGLDLYTTNTNMGIATSPSHSNSQSMHPPPLPPHPFPLSTSSSITSGPSSSRTLHRTGTGVVSPVIGRSDSPMAHSITGDSVRSSRANSSFDSGGVGSYGSGGAVGGGGVGLAGPGNSANTPFYGNSMSAFSHDSLDSVGGTSQGSKTSGATGKGKSGGMGEVRMHGRGGAQNMVKNKDKDDERKKEKKEKSKAGGLLGIRGIL